MSVIRVNVTARLAPMSKNLERGIQGYIKEMTTTAWQSLNRRIPAKTGALRDSLRHTIEPKKGTIFTTSKINKQGTGTVPNYFWFVENDTKPHIIRPKGGSGVMVFNIGLWTIFATYPTKDGREGIQHTGTKGQHFLRDTIREVVQDQQRIFKKHIQNIAQV